MQKELTQAKVVVEAATQECNALLEVITTNTADVETKQEIAIAKEEELKVCDAYSTDKLLPACTELDLRCNKCCQKHTRTTSVAAMQAEPAQM